MDLRSALTAQEVNALVLSLLWLVSLLWCSFDPWHMQPKKKVKKKKKIF